MSDIELKPCPFCGSEEVTVVDGSTYRWCVAQCKTCGAQAGEVRKVNGMQSVQINDMRDAIAEWNNRSTPAPVAKKVPGVSARHAAKVWCSLKRSEKKRILKNLEVFVEQENGENDLSWSMRALEALYSEPSRVSAMLAAAQAQEGKP